MSAGPLTQTERDLLGQMARFAEQRAIDGVYVNKGYSVSVGAPVMYVIAIGEQALALEQILAQNITRDEIIVTSSARGFINSNDGN